jgi:hypothetical protein
MLKRSIAQGSEVETALAWLPAVSGADSVTADVGKSGGKSGGGISGKSRTMGHPRVIWSKGLFRDQGADGRRRQGTPSSPVPLHLQARGGQAAAGAGNIYDGDEGFSSSTRMDTVALGARAVPVGRGGVDQPQRWRAATLALAAAATAFTAVLVARTHARVPMPDAASPAPLVGGLDLRSDPPGAHVFVDGDPNGLVTPAMLTGLRAGRSIEIRIDKPGYQPVSKRVEIAAGQPRPLDIRLVEAAGTIVVEELPLRASLYVDDVLVEGTRPISLPLGPHRLRVETSAELYFSRDIDVHPGEQRIRVEAPPRREREGGRGRERGRRGG